MRAWALISGLCLLAPACDEGAACGEECSSDDDCGGGLACGNGVCAPSECRTCWSGGETCSWDDEGDTCKFQQCTK